MSVLAPLMGSDVVITSLDVRSTTMIESVSSAIAASELTVVAVTEPQIRPRAGGADRHRAWVRDAVVLVLGDLGVGVGVELSLRLGCLLIAI